MNSPIAEMVKLMLEKGVAHDAIVMAVEGAEQAMLSRQSADVRVTERDVTAERRRESDRLRQQTRRDNLRMSRDNPQTSADVTNASLSKEENKKEIKKERGTPKVASRGQRLPEDWAPSLPDQVVADETIGPERRRDELAKFRDHWKQQPGTKGVKLDWDAAWRNWIRRAAEYGGNRNGHRNIHPTRRSASSDFFAGIAGVAADIAGDGATSGDAGPEVPLGRVNIDG